MSSFTDLSMEANRDHLEMQSPEKPPNPNQWARQPKRRATRRRTSSSDENVKSEPVAKRHRAAEPKMEAPVRRSSRRLTSLSIDKSKLKFEYKDGKEEDLHEEFLPQVSPLKSKVKREPRASVIAKRRKFETKPEDRSFCNEKLAKRSPSGSDQSKRESVSQSRSSRLSRPSLRPVRDCVVLLDDCHNALTKVSHQPSSLLVRSFKAA
ncbi:unnamed protein product [Echinostoma caproni]|uniref:Shugoshin_C domain-containing protein n=1 Tax=Echinostoma caproni TaxID=27848 RepID=A0A183A084_9TREM|nr:unnamed protein product [Echinostoma caproni]